MNDDMPQLFTWRSAAALVIMVILFVALYSTYAYLGKAKDGPYEPPKKPKVWID